MDPFEVGDPYIEWEEGNSSREEFNDSDPLTEFFIEEHSKMENVEELVTLKDEVVKLLMSNHDFSIEEAEEAVKDSTTSHPDMWNENADAGNLADFLASEDNDD